MNNFMHSLNFTPTLTAEPSQTYHHGTYNYPAEVRDAGHMGRGVFARKIICKYEPACFYDGILVNSNTYLEISLAASIVANSWDHNQKINDNLVIAGITEQWRPGGIGQLVNDATTSTDKKSRDKSLYNVTDVMTEGNCLLMVATRDIQEGEQLLYDYGAPYWQAREQRLARMGNRTVREHLEIILGLEQYFGNDDPEIIPTLMQPYTDGPNDLNDPVRHYRNRYNVLEAIRAIQHRRAQDS